MTTISGVITLPVEAEPALRRLIAARFPDEVDLGYNTAEIIQDALGLADAPVVRYARKNMTVLFDTTIFARTQGRLHDLIEAISRHITAHIHLIDTHGTGWTVTCRHKQFVVSPGLAPRPLALYRGSASSLPQLVSA